jgi:hypothetical protein
MGVGERRCFTDLWDIKEGLTMLVANMMGCYFQLIFVFFVE